MPILMPTARLVGARFTGCAYFVAAASLRARTALQELIAHEKHCRLLPQLKGVKHESLALLPGMYGAVVGGVQGGLGLARTSSTSPSRSRWRRVWSFLMSLSRGLVLEVRSGKAASLGGASH